MFVEPFDPSKPLDMPEACSECGQSMLPEPGYWYGAMFISYILTGWAVLIPTLFFVFVLDWNIWAALGLPVVVMLIFFYKILRGSRSLYMHMMIKYRPEAAKSKSST